MRFSISYKNGFGTVVVSGAKSLAVEIRENSNRIAPHSLIVWRFVLKLVFYETSKSLSPNNFLVVAFENVISVMKQDIDMFFYLLRKE